MLPHVVSYKLTDVSDVLAASIIREMMKTVSTSEISASF
jgi:hypothetical protein